MVSIRKTKNRLKYALAVATAYIDRYKRINPPTIDALVWSSRYQKEVGHFEQELKNLKRKKL